MSNFEQENHNDNAVGGAPHTSADDAPKVGYGHPPHHTRFKPGQSGNPKGRSKGSQNHKTTVSRVLNEKVSVREGDKTRSMTKAEAIMQTHALKGMKGDARSASILFGLMDKTGLLADGEDAIKRDAVPTNTNIKPVKPGDALFDAIDAALLSEDELIELSRLAEIMDQDGGYIALSADEFGRLKELANKGRRKDRAA